MPIQTCIKGEKVGFKFGDNGHCYIGPNARQQAAKQGAAIEISKHSKGEASNENFQELISILEFDEQVQLTIAYNKIECKRKEEQV